MVASFVSFYFAQAVAEAATAKFLAERKAEAARAARRSFGDESQPAGARQAAALGAVVGASVGVVVTLLMAVSRLGKP